MSKIWILLVVILLAGSACTRVDNQQGSSVGSQPLGGAVPSAEPPKALTISRDVATEAKQAERDEAIRAAVAARQKQHESGTNKNLPKWVADHYAAYEARDYTRGKTAFQRSVGWGTGAYKGKLFYWFAYTNTDAYLQFDLSTAIGVDDLARIVIGRKDGYGRSRVSRTRDCEWLESGNPTHRPSETWIGDTNDWTEKECARPTFDPCDIGSALERSVADLNNDLPGLRLAIKGKFPW